MNRIPRYLATCGLLLAVLLGVPTTSHAQTVLTTLTNSVAITTTDQRTFTVSSLAGVTAGTELFVPLSGEIMCVQSTDTTAVSVTVRRACDAGGSLPGTVAVTTTMIIVPPTFTGAAFGDKDPGGSCTRGLGLARVSPYINKMNAWMWVCIGSVWRGAVFKNETLNSIPPFTP